MSDIREFHFLTRKQRNENNSEKELTLAAAAGTGPITEQAGSKLTSDYKKSITDGHGRLRPIPLTAKAGAPLEGFFFGYLDDDGNDNGLKNLLQNNNFVGFYLGIGEDINSKSHTLVLYGVTQRNGDVLTLHEVDNEIYDFCDPCPPVCKS